MSDLGYLSDKIDKTLDVTLKAGNILLIGVSHGVFTAFLGGATIVTTTNHLLNGNEVFFNYPMIAESYACNVTFIFKNVGGKLHIYTYTPEYNKNAGGGSIGTNLWVTSVSKIPCNII